MRILSIVFLGCVLFLSCSSKQEEGSVSISSAREATPEEIIVFDQVEDSYFSYLGFVSEVVDSGNFVLPLASQGQLVLISKNGREVLSKTKNGRGPGELMSAFSISKSKESYVYVYDQLNERVSVFDKDLNTSREYLITRDKYDGISRYYAGFGDQDIIEMYDANPLSEDDDIILRVYNTSNERFEAELRVPDRISARLPGRGMQVPFTDRQLFAFSADRQSVFLLNSGSNLIAEVDFSFDTLRTISVKLPMQELSETERDSLRQYLIDDESEEFWAPMSELLPEFKTPAERMLIDWKDRIWLKSNIRGNYDKWFVLSQEGEIELIVKMPRNSDITHISRYHIGVRLKDHLFALYKPVD